MLVNTLQPFHHVIKIKSCDETALLADFDFICFNTINCRIVKRMMRCHMGNHALVLGLCNDIVTVGVIIFKHFDYFLQIGTLAKQPSSELGPLDAIVEEVDMIQRLPNGRVILNTERAESRH